MKKDIEFSGFIRHKIKHRGEFPNILGKHRALGSVDNIKRKLNKCRFHSLFIKYSIRKCRKSQLENKIILFALWKVFQYFNDRALLELCKIALYDVSSSVFCSTTHVWAKFWQPSYCLSGPPILSGKRGNKTFPAWTKGCKDTIDTVAMTFSKTWHRVLRTLSLFFLFLYENIGFSRWKETESSKYLRTRLLSQLRRLH